MAKRPSPFKYDITFKVRYPDAIPVPYLGTETNISTTTKDVFLERCQRIIHGISYKKGWTFWCYRVPGQLVLFDITAELPDVRDGHSTRVHSGPTLLEEAMNDSHILRRVFQATLAFEEHECREHFKYKSQMVFNPHEDLACLKEPVK